MGGAPLKYAKGALSNVSVFGHKRPHVYEAKVDSTLALKSVNLLELIGLLD